MSVSHFKLDIIQLSIPPFSTPLNKQPFNKYNVNYHCSITTITHFNTHDTHSGLTLITHCERKKKKNIPFSPEPSVKKENPMKTSSKAPNKQICIRSNSFRLFLFAFVFLNLAITCAGQFRSRIPDRDIPSWVATPMLVTSWRKPAVTSLTS